MDFLQLVKDRYSVRKFDPRKIEQEKLDLILEAGRVAPTAVNYQPQRIFALDSEENLALVKSCTPYHFRAPLVLVVCYDIGTAWRNPAGDEMGIVDASIVTTHMMLEAANLGIGSTWVGHFDRAALREAFHIPDFLIPVALLPLGYPSSEAKPHPTMHSSRLDINETVFYNSFDGVTPGEKHGSRH